MTRKARLSDYADCPQAFHRHSRGMTVRQQERLDTVIVILTAVVVVVAVYLVSH